MKRVVVMAGALALASCGSGTDSGETASAAPVTDTATTAIPAELVGTYGADGTDGRAWTTTLAADGTYRNTVAGELTESGRWNKSGEQICFNPVPVAGEEATPTCQTLLAVNDDGSLVVRDQDGQETTAPRLGQQ